MVRKTPYAVKVVLDFADGTTLERHYVRGPMNIAKYAFDAFAVGDLLGYALSERGEVNNGGLIGVRTYEADPLEVGRWGQDQPTKQVSPTSLLTER